MLTCIEVKNSPLACSVYTSMDDLKSCLEAGTHKVAFGVETDR